MVRTLLESPQNPIELSSKVQLFSVATEDVADENVDEEIEDASDEDILLELFELLLLLFTLEDELRLFALELRELELKELELLNELIEDV